MTFNQVNPALLEGEELRRWYQRSPQEIEDERQAAAQARYQAFFYPQQLAASQLLGQSQEATIQQGRAGGSGQPRWAAMGTGAQDTARTTELSLAPPAAIAGLGAGAADCFTCHGRAQPPVPFPFPFPMPWPSPPVNRDLPTDSPSKPPERDRKQCEIQLQRDSDTCNSQPNNASKAVCNETKMKRYSHCLRTGEVGEPDLFTIPRMPPRSW